MTSFDPFDPKTWDAPEPETPHLASEVGDATKPGSFTFEIAGELYTVDGENIVDAFAKALIGSGRRGEELSIITQVGLGDNPSYGVTSVAILRACSRGYLDDTWIEDSLLLMAQEEAWVARVAVLDVLHPREIRHQLLKHFGRMEEL